MTTPTPKFVSIMGKVSQAMAVDAAELINHKASKGRERERRLLRDYLERYLPRSVQPVQSAEILDSKGAVSPECDLVIVDPRTPPLHDDGGFQILPSECVYGVIEVKSRLDGKELEDSVRKIQAIKRLDKSAFRPQLGDVINQVTRAGKPYDYFPTLGHIFAYSSISLALLGKQLRDLQNSIPIEERVDGIFVLNKGGLVYFGADGQPDIVCQSETAPIVVFEAENPLISMTLALQAKYAGAWNSGFRISAYLQGLPWGNVIGTI